jgi:ABC-type sugar transport system ATPase subunit
MEPLVETRAVSKRYGTTVALNSVSLKIHGGHSLALAGRNGAGKSTMVRLLTGLDRPDAGEVRFAGQPAPDISARARWRADRWRESVSQRPAGLALRNDQLEGHSPLGTT